MTKNISCLYFSFAFKGLLALESACISVCSGRHEGATVSISKPYSNLRPGTSNPYRAARARTIPDKILEVKP